MVICSSGLARHRSRQHEVHWSTATVKRADYMSPQWTQQICLPRGASQAWKSMSAPQTVWQPCPRDRSIHFLSISFFFLLRERPYSFCERLKRSPQVHWLNASGHNKHYKPADIKRAQRRHRNSLQALYILSTRIQVSGARTKRYLNNSSV